MRLPLATVANCFRHSGFVRDTTEEADNLDESIWMIKIMKRLWKGWTHYYHRTMPRTYWMSMPKLMRML